MPVYVTPSYLFAALLLSSFAVQSAGNRLNIEKADCRSWRLVALDTFDSFRKIRQNNLRFGKNSNFKLPGAAICDVGVWPYENTLVGLQCIWTYPAASPLSNLKDMAWHIDASIRKCLRPMFSNAPVNDGIVDEDRIDETKLPDYNSNDSIQMNNSSNLSNDISGTFMFDNGPGKSMLTISIDTDLANRRIVVWLVP